MTRYLHRTLATVLAASLAGAPLASALARNAAPRAGSDRGGRSKALRLQLDRLHTGVNFCKEDPRRCTDALERYLSGLHRFAPEIAQKQELQTLQRRAILSLARAYKNSDRFQRAEKVLTNIYRSDPPRTTEIERLGPSLVTLSEKVKRRVGTLGRGTIKINCLGPCEVFVNERSSSKRSNHIEGEYRVYVRDLQGRKEALQQVVEIHPGGGDVLVHYKNGGEADTGAGDKGKVGRKDLLEIVDPSRLGEDPGRLDRGRTGSNARLAPAWLEITGLAAGIAAIGTGAALIAMNGECPPNRDGNCVNHYTTKLAGIITTSAGAATAIVFGVLLAIDQSQSNRRPAIILGKTRWKSPFHFEF